MNNKIIGFCRTSFLGQSDWRAMHHAGATTPDGLAKRAKTLYDPQRLEQRFFTLEHITFASLAVQTDQDFEFVVLTSASMPEEWLHRLSILCDRLPQARLVISKETDVNVALAPYLQDTFDKHRTPLLQFRLDDDDAVGFRYIETLRAHGRMLAKVPRFAISFPRGLSVRTYDGAAPTFWQTHRGFVSAGAAARFPKTTRSIFSLNHFDLPRRSAAFTDPSILGHFVLLWDSGGTAPSIKHRIPWGYESMDEAQFKLDLERHFPSLVNVDWSKVQKPPS